MTETLARHLLDGDPAPVLGLYLLLHLFIAPLLPSRAPRPLAAAFFFAGGRFLERRLNRAARGAPALFLRGLVVTALLVVLAACIGHAAAGRWLFSLFLLGACVTAMGPLGMSQRVLALLRQNDRAGAAGALGPYVQEAIDISDAHAVARKTVEVSSIALCRLFVGPVLWFLLAGPLGMMVYTVLASLAASFGAGRVAFARVAQRADAIMNVVPAFMTAVLLCFCAVCAGFVAPMRAVRIMMTQGLRGGAPWLGAPLAAMAGALGVTLAYTGAHHGWIGPKDSSARVTPADLARAIALQYAVFLLGTAFIFLIIYAQI